MFKRFIFHPCQTHSIFSKMWKKSELTLHLNNQHLQGWLIKNERPEYAQLKEGPFIIYYGGNAEDISLNLSYIEEVNAASFLFMNYRGYGGSSGQPTEQGLLEDALSIYDYVVKEYHISPSNIYLIGRSLGSSIASYVASQRRVGGLILVTPFDSIENLVKKLFRWLPFIGWFFRDCFNTHKHLTQVDCEVLVLAAEKDEIIPESCLQPLIASYRHRLSLVTIKNADHQDIGEYEAYYDAINQFLRTYLDN